jgi:hypothetical protein
MITKQYHPPEFGVHSDYEKAWVIEVADGPSNTNSWVEINRRENNQTLNDRGIVRTFPISHPQNSGFHGIRLRQIGANHRLDHYLAISAFELFGELRVRTPISNDPRSTN